MEQKNSKIALFMIVFSFCLDFIQGNPISNLGMNCFKRAKLEQCINIDINSGLNICSQIDSNLECVEHLLSECYTTQELNHYKGLLIQSAVEVLISKDYAAKIEDCVECKDFASKGLVAGNNMGIMIALIIAVAYFGF